ncbi:MAG: DUF5615 family PIN-like protein [Elusimicrobiota bacterium]
MKLLLDECIDRRFAKDLKGHYVRTVPQMMWAGIKNGKLLALMEKEFDVFITVDSNMSFQQNLPRFKIVVFILHSKSNRLTDLKSLAPKILSELETMQEKKLIQIKI